MSDQLEFRKLISFGKSSFVVSLPKSWVTQNNLKKGDLIYFDEKESSLILNVKEKIDDEKEKSIHINIDHKEIRQVKREIISAYINNNKSIILAGNSIKEKTKSLHYIIQSLIALEVMEQDSKKIVARDFLNLNDVSTTTIMRKMDVVIRSMFSDTMRMFEEDTAESIQRRDHDVNKLSFLMFRIIRYGLHNYTYLSKQLQLQPVDMLYLWWLTFELEAIGDDVKRIARSMGGIEFNATQKKEFCIIIKELQNSYLSFMKAYYAIDAESVQGLVNTKENWLMTCDAFFQKYRSIKGIAYLIYHTKAAIVHINHIGRLLYQIKGDQQSVFGSR